MAQSALSSDQFDRAVRKAVEIDINNRVAHNLRIAAERSALPFAELARHIGISRQTLNKAFKGESALSPGHLKLAADFFDIPVSDFFVETEGMM